MTSLSPTLLRKLSKARPTRQKFRHAFRGADGNVDLSSIIVGTLGAKNGTSREQRKDGEHDIKLSKLKEKVKAKDKEIARLKKKGSEK